MNKKIFLVILTISIYFSMSAFKFPWEDESGGGGHEHLTANDFEDTVNYLELLSGNVVDFLEPDYYSILSGFASKLGMPAQTVNSSNYSLVIDDINTYITTNNVDYISIENALLDALNVWNSQNQSFVLVPSLSPENSLNKGYWLIKASSGISNYEAMNIKASQHNFCWYRVYNYSSFDCQINVFDDEEVVFISNRFLDISNMINTHGLGFVANFDIYNTSGQRLLNQYIRRDLSTVYSDFAFIYSLHDGYIPIYKSYADYYSLNQLGRSKIVSFDPSNFNIQNFGNDIDYSDLMRSLISKVDEVGRFDPVEFQRIIGDEISKIVQSIEDLNSSINENTAVMNRTLEKILAVLESNKGIKAIYDLIESKTGAGGSTDISAILQDLDEIKRLLYTDNDFTVLDPSVESPFSFDDPLNLESELDNLDLSINNTFLDFEPLDEVVFNIPIRYGDLIDSELTLDFSIYETFRPYVYLFVSLFSITFSVFVCFKGIQFINDTLGG